MALTRQTFRVRNELTRAMKAKPTKRRGDVVLEFDASLEAERRASGERQLAALIVDEIGQRVPADPLVQCGSPAAEIVAVARTGVCRQT